MRPRFLLCQFRPGDRGPYCEQPMGQFPDFGRVFPHRHNAVPIDVGTKYLCEVVHRTDRSHFVKVVKTGEELLTELLPLLIAATWKRGPHLTSDVGTECTSLHYGTVKATWYQSSGKRVHKFVCLKLSLSGEALELSLEPHDAPQAIEKRVRACVGPIAALAATISRQRDARTAYPW